MKTTQKVILGCTMAVSLVSGLANAAVSTDPVTVPAADAVLDVTPITVASGAYSSLVQTPFVFTRSRNVAVASIANAAGTGVAISTASAKGRNSFFANSGGSSAAVCGPAAVGSAAPAVKAVAAEHTESPGTLCN